MTSIICSFVAFSYNSFSSPLIAVSLSLSLSPPPLSLSTFLLSRITLHIYFVSTSCFLLFVCNFISFFISLISFLPLSYFSFPNLFRSSFPHPYLTFYLLYSYVSPTAHARCIMASGMIADQWRIGCKQCQWPGSCCRRGWKYDPRTSQ
jgi:hypothetical protein